MDLSKADDLTIDQGPIHEKDQSLWLSPDTWNNYKAVSVQSSSDVTTLSARNEHNGVRNESRRSLQPNGLQPKRIGAQAAIAGLDQ